MAKTTPIRNSFNAGEIGPLCEFRSDISKYDSACLTLENSLPLVEGGTKKMPGTYFAGATAVGGSGFIGSITGSQLTVTQMKYGRLGIGYIISGPNVTLGTAITSFGTGNGGVGTYGVSAAQTVASQFLQTASIGKSRLVPFQFSTIQGAILELSAGFIRIWEGASEGSWSLGLALEVPVSLNYNPATAYVAGNTVLIGPFLCFQFTGAPAGKLTIGTPYGTTNANTIPIGLQVNTSDALSVYAIGSSPNQGFVISLANTTPAKNSASLIQAAIRSLVSLNSGTGNFFDLTGWTVTPDPTYYASPWITVGSSIDYLVNVNFVGQCILSNQNDEFPLSVPVNSSGPVTWNTTYWVEFSEQNEPPIELVTPYLEQDLFDLDCSTQSADVLWIFHPNYAPAVIERLSANLWKYSLSLPGGQPGEPPYRGTTDVVKTGYSALGQNISLISQAAACTVVLASSSPTAPFPDGDRVYINLCAGMAELNQGEFLVSGITYGAVAIPVVDSTGTGSTVNATGWYFNIQDPNTGATINSSSFLQYAGGGFAVQVVPLFAAAGDFPACGTLYQERLWVGGTDNNPTQLNGSVEDDYPDFICDPNQDDYACQFTLVSNQVNQLLNMVGTPNGLAIGTSGGIWIITGPSGSSISQSGVDALQQSSYGVSSIQPQVVNGSAIFVSRSARIVTFLVFNFVTNQWENTDLTRLNRNITIGTSQATSGIAQTAFQMEPYPIFWAVRNDGQLLGLVFNTQDQVYAWFRVNMGAGFVESVAVISGQNQEDQVAVVVNRTINGVEQRYVEYFMPQELFHQLSNAFFVNCGLQLELVAPGAITGLTNANPCVVTVPNHGLTNALPVRIFGVAGMVQINQDQGAAYAITVIDANNFSLNGVDSTGWGSAYEGTHPFEFYIGGGTAQQVTNQLTGLSYLIGQTAVAVGDGALVLPPTEITSDSLTLPYFSNLTTIGIPYQTTTQPTNPVLSSQAATTRGMKQKLDRVTLSLYESMGGYYGTDLQHMHPIQYGQGAQAQQPAMTTDELTCDIDGDWTDKSTFYVVQDQPFPFTLRGLVWRDSANQD